MSIKKSFLEKFVYLIIFLLPIYLIKVRFFLFPTNVLEVGIIIFLLAYFSDKKRIKEFIIFVKKFKNIFRGIGIILLGIIISIVINGKYFVGLGILKGWFLIPILFSSIIISFLGKEEVKKVFLSYYLSALVVSFVSLIYFFLGIITFDGRLEGIFNSPNYLAMYLAPAIIIGCIGFYKNKSNIAKNGWKSINTINLITIIFVLICFYLTYSYAAWFSLGLSILIFFILNNKLNRKNIALIFLIFGILFVFEMNSLKFNNMFNGNGRSSFDSRIMIWQSAGKMIENDVFFGIGPGNFQEKYLEYQKYYPPYLEWAVPHPHNIFLAFWLYSGILGLVGFFYVLYLFFKKILLNKNKLPMVYMALLIIIDMLLHGFVDTTYFKNDLAIVFWVMILFGYCDNE